MKQRIGFRQVVGNWRWALRLAVLWLLSPAVGIPVEIIAHRRASFDAPENTLPAVLLAWERGADAVEVDIHQTRDGHIVAIHDRDTMRVTGREGRVAGMLLEQLRLLEGSALAGNRDSYPPGRARHRTRWEDSSRGDQVSS